MPEGGWIEVEVVYALPRRQTVVSLAVPAGATVKAALAQSGIAAKHPEIIRDALAIGIFGTRVSLATVLDDHDRIEIYRPLIADPKQARRARAREAAKESLIKGTSPLENPLKSERSEQEKRLVQSFPKIKR